MNYPPRGEEEKGEYMNEISVRVGEGTHMFLLQELNSWRACEVADEFNSRWVDAVDPAQEVASLRMQLSAWEAFSESVSWAEAQLAGLE